MLFTITCYYVKKNTANKIGLETNVTLPHIKQHVDLSIMTGHTFLKGLLGDQITDFIREVNYQ